MRTSIKIISFAFCASILLSYSFIKYSSSLDITLANLNAYAATFSPSKIYLHTDRSIYALEDTVWFKAYNLDATHHSSVAKSEVVYVDILDSNGKKVDSKKLYAENTGAASDFIIEREWQPGRYKLRAYTKYMLNQDQEYIYNKEIKIVDINKAYKEIFTSPDSLESEKQSSTVTSLTPSLDIKFFPESGDLVADIFSRVAIKIENYSAELGDISGVIEDKQGNTIVSFQIFERGYGLASFAPEVGKEYFAKLNNDPQLYPLPKVKAKGYNITTLSRSNFVSFIISSNVDSGLSGGDILIHSRGQLLQHVKIEDTDENSYALKLDTKDVPIGVTQITFFDKDGVPRSERLFFVDQDLPETLVKTDKAIYKKREKVDLGLSVSNENLKSYDCSVSVFDKSNLEGAPPSDNVKTWMLLNSDLRGEINDPAFYFDNPRSRKKAMLLDLVMMTHGWRRFAWEDMSQEDIFENSEFERELGLYIKGHTSRFIKSKKPIKSNIQLNFLNYDMRQDEFTTEDDGRFSFGPYIIKDSLVAIIQARRYAEENEKEFLEGNRKLNINLEATQKLTLEKPIFKEGSDFDYESYKTFINTNRNSQAIKDHYHDMEVSLSEINITARRKSKEKEFNKISFDKGLYTTPSNRVILENNDRSKFRTVFDILQSIPGVTVTGGFPNQRLIVRGVSSILTNNSALILIDGFQSDIDFLNAINIDEILFVDVLKGVDAAIYGSRGANGVVAVYTGRNKDSKVTKRKPGIINFTLYGFDSHRQFYSPDYSKNVSKVYEPDVRTTLYWNPYVHLSKGEENTFSFFTGDNAGNYIVTMEGLSEDGDPIFGTFEFSVVDH